MNMVNAYEAKTHLSQLLDRVESGDHITLARAGRPVAVLVPHQRPNITFGLLKEKLDFNTADFDTVDEEIIALFEGRALLKAAKGPVIIDANL